MSSVYTPNNDCSLSRTPSGRPRMEVTIWNGSLVTWARSASDTLMGGDDWLLPAASIGSTPRLDASAARKPMTISALRFFVQTELVPDWIREGGERAHARADLLAWCEHATARALHLLQRVRDGVHHDVDAGALVGRAIAFLHPGSAHGAGVVKGQLAVAARPDLPTEDAAVEIGGILG